ncbi:MAG TPA: YggS family pyridoxal phosphate-dependent enzyme, partial [Dehalococcoidia bacterium]|nr:YggS family pyridoxal phosphate-dependent enzyme [Dehalococcoidia bacterium]
MKTASIAERAQEVLSQVAAACERAGRNPQEVRVVAISKTFPASMIREAAAAGFRDIGENRVQEAAEKLQELDDLDVTWHLVGHLQTNK